MERGIPVYWEMTGGIIDIVHSIVIDGQEIYKGDDWYVASQLFIKHVHDPRFQSVHHKTEKFVSYPGAPPPYWELRK